MTAPDADDRAARRALSGRVIVLTRPEGYGDDLAVRLRSLGAVPVVVPLLRFAPPASATDLDSRLRRLSEYDWIVFTSRTAVTAVLDRLGDLGLETRQPAGVRVAAVGTATATALRERGWDVAVVPSTFRADALVDALCAFEPGVRWNRQRVFWPRAEAADRGIVAALTARGAVVDEAVAYRTVLAADAGPALATASANADAVVLASGSAARAMAALVADAAAWARIPIVCIGPVTARAARDVGLSPAAVAAEATTAGVVGALRDALRRQE